MTISTELFAAILSMDAYNRGYNAGLSDGINVVDGVDSDGLGESGLIGTAQIINPSSVGIGESEYQAWKAAGFYAVAYDWNGQTVISYRGTDQLLSSPWRDDPGSDIWNGYLQGAGQPMSNQSILAAQFFQATTGG